MTVSEKSSWQINLEISEKRIIKKLVVYLLDMVQAEHSSRRICFSQNNQDYPLPMDAVFHSFRALSCYRLQFFDSSLHDSMDDWGSDEHTQVQTTKWDELAGWHWNDSL